MGRVPGGPHLLPSPCAPSTVPSRTPAQHWLHPLRICGRREKGSRSLSRGFPGQRRSVVCQAAVLGCKQHRSGARDSRCSRAVAPGFLPCSSASSPLLPPSLGCRVLGATSVCGLEDFSPQLSKVSFNSSLARHLSSPLLRRLRQEGHLIPQI